MARPNILFLFSDQQRYDTLGVLNDKIQTPNLDRLARSGMLCERTYAPTPVCLPCRASLVTGQYASTHGAMHNGSFLPRDYALLFPAIVSRQGYFTHIIGKSHLTSCHDPASFESYPHIGNRAYFRSWHGPWYGFQRADITIGHTTEHHAHGMHYGVWLEDQGVDIERYFGHTAYPQFGVWDLPAEYHNSKWAADTTIESIREGAEREQPFFIWSNFQDPHNPCMVPEPWASMYDPHEIPHFGFKPGEPSSYETKPNFYRELIEQPGPYACHSSDPGLGIPSNVSHLPFTPEETQQNAACYYGMVSLMDYHIGRILDTLEETGQLDNTLIVFSSDHGDFLGDHGLWWKGAVAFEECMRVPCIVSYPGHVPADTRSTALQSLVDLPPTFLDYLGVPIPTAMEGVCQRRAWENPEARTRDYVVVEERPHDSDFSERFLITDTHKLCVYHNRPYGELYDIEHDPDQIENLWEEAAYAGLKMELLQKLLHHEMNKGYPRPRPSAFIERGVDA